MRVSPVGLPGLALVRFTRFQDERGWFSETFRQETFDLALAESGLPAAGPLVQDNHSSSAPHVLRGLHYQLPPWAQGKLVRVVRGRIFDVAVDIRAASPHFGCWFGIELTAGDPHHLWIPPGFAHGFCAAAEGAEVLYKTSAYYAPQFERSLLWNDPDIGIAWPGDTAPLLSPKDRTAPTFAQSRLELAQAGF